MTAALAHINSTAFTAAATKLRHDLAAEAEDVDLRPGSLRVTILEAEGLPEILRKGTDDRAEAERVRFR